MRPQRPVRLKGIKADWKHPTEIRFGLNRIRELPEVCWKLGVRCPLLVTDSVVAGLPFIRTMLRLNRAQCIETGMFSDMAGEPDSEAINLGTEAFIKGRFDGLIGVGGGSALDAAKAISLAAAVGPSGMWRYSAEICSAEPTPRPLPPIIAIPTTAGTGSEVDAYAVILERRQKRKLSLNHPDMLPSVVIADPTLTRRLIPYLTAATGMDALSHNLEALCSPLFQPILDAIAMQGVCLAKDWLPVAFRDGGNLEARVYTMAASIMGAMAFEKGLGAMHAIAHAVGGRYTIQHGRAVGAIMPFVLAFNRPLIEEKIAVLARNMDLPGRSFESVLQWILDLRFELGLPLTLGELGVSDDDVPVITDAALQDVNLATNPASLDRQQLERLLSSAIQGRMELCAESSSTSGTPPTS